MLVVVIQSLSCVQLFATPWTDCSMPGFPCPSPFLILLKLMSIEIMIPSNHLILYCPLLILPSIFPSVMIFPNELTLRIRWPRYWSFSFSVSPFNEYLGLIFLKIAGFNFNLSKGLSRVFFSITVQKHQFFSAQPSLWSNSHIHTWLLEKPQLWLCRPLSAKWWLCF